MTDASPPIDSKRFRRALVVFNPTAGARRRKRLAAVLDGLTGLSCHYDLFRTSGRGDAESAAKDAGDRGYDLIIAAGGDGTVNEIANGLASAKTPIPMAVLPLGTANVLAAEIGLKTNPQSVLSMIAGGRTRSIRLGEAEGRYFVLMASAGLDSAVVRGVNLALKRSTGQLAYGVEALVQAFSYSFPELIVTIDGVDHSARMVVACKARCYGGPFQAAPRADLSDGLIHAVLMKQGGLAATLRYGMALALGRLPLLPDVEIIPAQRMKISAASGVPLQADGDLIASLPVEIAVSDHMIDLVVP